MRPGKPRSVIFDLAKYEVEPPQLVVAGRVVGSRFQSLGEAVMLGHIALNAPP